MNDLRVNLNYNNLQYATHHTENNALNACNLDYHSQKIHTNNNQTMEPTEVYNNIKENTIVYYILY